MIIINVIIVDVIIINVIIVDVIIINVIIVDVIIINVIIVNVIIINVIIVSAGRVFSRLIIDAEAVTVSSLGGLRLEVSECTYKEFK